MKYLIFPFLLSLLIITSCEETKHKDQHLKFYHDYGKWTFIEVDSEEKVYAEIDFKKNNTVRIYSEKDASMGPFSFNLDDKYLSINDIMFEIIPGPNKSFLLKNDKYEYILYQINFKEEGLNKDQIDPFYIRKCYFFVHLNFMTTQKAIEYLKEIRLVDEDSIIEEEIIIR